MIVTEAEAKTKWCSHSRVIYNMRDDGLARDAKGDLIRDDKGNPIRTGPPTHAATSYNRSSDAIPLASCLASGCMSWDWFDRIDVSNKTAAEAAEIKANRRGYCGLGKAFKHYKNRAEEEAALTHLAELPAGPAVPAVEVIDPAKVEVLSPQANGQA